MKSEKLKISELVMQAREARRFARAEYSGFRVGAALETADGRVFTGINVESSSYGLTMCAERVALFKALSEGADRFTRLVVATEADPPAAPCGACRQLLWDYARGIEIIIVGSKGEPVRTTIEELFPRPFGKEAL
jgi:homotetrameric cytidine deaminase